jgi:integrase/recombinase XerC
MGLIAANLIRSLEKPKAGRRDHVIPVEQFKTMCSLIRDDEFRELLTVCWETGCRPQEVLSVEARHVDATVGCWVFPVSKSKGKQQQRNVYLTDTALTITRRLMTAFPRGPLFRNTNGRPRSAAAVNRRFARLRLALGRQKIEVLGLTTPKLKRLTKAQRNDVATASAS